MTLLEASHLVKTFGRRGHRFHAVDDVSFTLAAGETLALVGESGAGKSTTGRLVLRLIEPDEGTVRLDGQEITGLDQRRLRVARRSMQMVFQDPYSCFDPRIPIGDSVGEPLRAHFRLKASERAERAAAMLARVGLGTQHLYRFPHELSGGQLQRVAIARALMLEPKLIVCDEPVAALDVSVRAQVINLLSDLQDELGIAYLFISHDLALVEVIAHRVAVMQRGRIVELADTAQLFEAPQSNYTRELLSAIPTIGPNRLSVRRSS